MFPDRAQMDLLAILKNHDGNLEQAALALLSQQQDRSDQYVACALLHQMANEWERTTRRTIPEDVRADVAKLEAFMRGTTERKNEAALDAAKLPTWLQSVASMVRGSFPGFLRRISSPAPITNVLPMVAVAPPLETAGSKNDTSGNNLASPLLQDYRGEE